MAVRRFAGPQRVLVTTGNLHRRTLKRRLMVLGLDFKEDRGFLRSAYAVDVPDGKTFVLYGSEVA